MDVRIVPWSEPDRELLHAILGDPAMMEHLGGPEPATKIDERHARYVAMADGADGCTFKVVVDGDARGAGWVGFWPSSWGDEDAWEMGWSVLPAFQGRGVGSAAARLAIDRARRDGRFAAIVAFPDVSNLASNAVCRKLGFEDRGETTVEFPKGRPMRVRAWRLALPG